MSKSNKRVALGGGDGSKGMWMRYANKNAQNELLRASCAKALHITVGKQ